MIRTDAALREPNLPLTENAASYLRSHALVRPGARALVARRISENTAAYTELSFLELDRRSDQAAMGLRKYGICRGQRVLMMVPPGEEFIILWFALLKIGAAAVMIDPGMGGRSLLRCIRDVRPEALIGVPLAHALKKMFPRSFCGIKQCVSVGRGIRWGGLPYNRLFDVHTAPFELEAVAGDETAAIVFTTGSTGLAKGVLCSHRALSAQIELLRTAFSLSDDDVGLCAFLPFALYCIAMGTTAIMPNINPRKPANADPAAMASLAARYHTSYSFGSPAFWRPVAEHCVRQSIRLPSLTRVIMFGAPMPNDLHSLLHRVLPEHGDTHTPYGATEALPLTTISGREIIGQIPKRFAVCVGRPLPNTQIKLIRVSDDSIPDISQVEEVPAGEIGEIVANGVQVSTAYCNRPVETKAAKIRDGFKVWHRMGDVGFLDSEGRLWFCGRKKHRVVHNEETLYTVPCEAVFNTHPEVARSALVGVGPAGRQTPVICIERKVERSLEASELQQELLRLAAAEPHTRSIRTVLFHPSFPVDFRHNAKIIRESLASWAERKLR